MKKLFPLLIIVVMIFVFLLISKGFLRNSAKHECTNYQEIEFFDKPINIEWKAKIDGCLMSCWGASFTRIDLGEEKKEQFAGYVLDEEGPISKDIVESDKELLVTGKWTNVSDDHVSIFNEKCVPTVEIEKIEFLENVTN